MSRPPLRGLLPDGDGLTHAMLGPLERRVLDVVWDRDGETTVADVHAAFADTLAYTTLMTTMDRLFKKGLLDRRRDGRAFLYSPRMSAAQLEQGVVASIVGQMLARGGEARPVLSCLVDTVSQLDEALLDELEELIRGKRRASRGR